MNSVCVCQWLTQCTCGVRLEAAGWLLGGYANAFEAAQGEGQYDHALTPARCVPVRVFRAELESVSDMPE